MSEPNSKVVLPTQAAELLGMKLPAFYKQVRKQRIVAEKNRDGYQISAEELLKQLEKKYLKLVADEKAIPEQKAHLCRSAETLKEFMRNV